MYGNVFHGNQEYVQVCQPDKKMVAKMVSDCKGPYRSQTSYAEGAGVSPGLVRRYMRGIMTPGFANLRAIVQSPLSQASYSEEDAATACGYVDKIRAQVLVKTLKPEPKEIPDFRSNESRNSFEKKEKLETAHKKTFCQNLSFFFARENIPVPKDLSSHMEDLSADEYFSKMLAFYKQETIVYENALKLYFSKNRTSEPPVNKTVFCRKVILDLMENNVLWG